MTHNGGLRLDMQRVLGAPRSVVFRALSEPQELVKWWGPDGFIIPSVESDLRPGGSYRIAMQPPEGDLFYLTGKFLEVDPPQRLSYTFRWEDPGPRGPRDVGDAVAPRRWRRVDRVDSRSGRLRNRAAPRSSRGRLDSGPQQAGGTDVVTGGGLSLAGTTCRPGTRSSGRRWGEQPSRTIGVVGSAAGPPRVDGRKRPKGRSQNSSASQSEHWFSNGRTGRSGSFTVDISPRKSLGGGRREVRS